MSKGSWPRFSFAEMLKPPDGWRTDHAILCTYSADLIVIVTSLLALGGADVEGRTASRVELVRAIEALRGRVRVLAQEGRVGIPRVSLPILRLLDRFLLTVTTDERSSSFHPKAALLRFQRINDPNDSQWRIWFGSRNLTQAWNWETGLVLVSRSDGKGQRVEGLADVGSVLAERARLTGLTARRVKTELSKLTWECPPGCEVTRVSLLGPSHQQGFPAPPIDTERMFVVSPFLDAKTVRLAGAWGGPKTRRTIVSTDLEFQRLIREDREIFDGFENLCRQPLPDLPTEYAVNMGEENRDSIEMSEGEEAPPQGLHAKLLFAAKGKRRQLWLGSPNATQRGWLGKNVEIVAELAINQEVADGIEEFVDTCERYTLGANGPEIDEDEVELENARKALSGRWPLRQVINEGLLEIIASSPPPIVNPQISVEAATMGGTWKPWPLDTDRLLVGSLKDWERTDFVQVRVRLRDLVCAWLQLAPCLPPPDEQRDHNLIAQYLDPHTFLWWIRSLLEDSPVEGNGGDWNSENDPSLNASRNGFHASDHGASPSLEEILRAWARDPLAFRNADQKVKTYLTELERHAAEKEAPADIALLQTFRNMWDTLAGGLR